MPRTRLRSHAAAKSPGAGSTRRAIPMLVSGMALMAGVLASPAAYAQCTGNGTMLTDGGSVNALASVIGTVNTAFLTSGSAFVSAPNSAPNQQGGGVWVRTIGGTVDTQGSSNFSGLFTATSPGPPLPPSYSEPAALSCHTKVEQDFTGFQAGHDIAVLNAGGSGASWHLGVLAGYVGANAKDVTAGSSSGSLNGNFDAPFAGLYTAFFKGNFFADAQARLDYFQGDFFDRRFDARGYSFTGNTGYRFDLGGTWTLEPSVGFSRTSVDPLNLL